MVELCWGSAMSEDKNMYQTLIYCPIYSPALAKKTDLAGDVAEWRAADGEGD
jgi:hypothetical protein